MFRARLASVFVAATLAASGGCTSLTDHPWFNFRRDESRCCPSAPCCEGCGCGTGVESAPIVAGPMLAPTESYMPGNGATMPIGPASTKLMHTPQSTPMPYTP